MEALIEVLQRSLNPCIETRHTAEEYIQQSLCNNEFVISLCELSSNAQYPLHLRQFSLVLINQQVQRRLQSFSVQNRAYLRELAFSVLGGGEQLLLGCGTLLLAYLFSNGSSEEKESIMSKLYSALSSEDTNAIHLACRCVCEIVEDTSFMDQINVLTSLHSRLRYIAESADRSEVELLRCIGKVYRVVATKVRDCKLADDFTADVDNAVTGVFESWLSTVCLWSIACVEVEDIMTSLGVLVEIARFIGVVVETFPLMCGANSSAVQSAMHSAWRFLHVLVRLRGDEEAEALSGVDWSQIAHDGDRLGVDVLVIHLFEMLKACFNVPTQQSKIGKLNTDDMSQLILVLMQYFRLTPEQLNQIVSSGNEFIASEQDDSYELSMRHAGRLFLIEVYGSSPRTVFDSLLNTVERELKVGLQGFQKMEVSFEMATWFEAVLLAFISISRPFLKRHVRSQRAVDSARSSVSKSKITDYDISRVVEVLRVLTDTFNVVPPITGRTEEQNALFSVVRCAVSRTVTAYACLLAPHVDLSHLILTTVELVSPNYKQESHAARLEHCRALGELLNAAAKHFGSVQVMNGLQGLDRCIQGCISMCTDCTDATIHIPLESVSVFLRVANTATDERHDSSSAPRYMSNESVSSLVQVGLAVWSNYCYDPFALEVAREMMLYLVQYCLSRKEELSVFCEHYMAPLEHLIDSVTSGESGSKSICDMAIKLLVDAAARRNDDENSSNDVLVVPSLRAIVGVMSTYVRSDGCVDIGDTLFSLLCLLSTTTLNLNNAPEELKRSLSAVSLQCVQQIFASFNEYMYSAAMGTMCQIATRLKDFTSEETLHKLLQCALDIVLNTGRGNNHRNIVIMGLVHIFCRNPVLVGRALNSVRVSPQQTALQYFFEAWYCLHPKLESPYSLAVSTAGLVEATRLYSQQGSSSGFLIRTLKVLLSTLQTLLLNDPSASAQLCDDDSAEDFSCEGSDYDSGCSDDDLDGDYDPFDISGCDENSPFAPAEMYLSDIMDSNLGAKGSHVYIPNDMVFFPWKRDPVCGVSVKTRIGLIVSLAEQQPKGMLMECLNSLDVAEQQLLNQLVSQC